MCFYWNFWRHMISFFRIIYIFLVTMGTWFSITFGGLPVFIFSGVSIFVSLGSTLGGLPGLLICVFALRVGAFFLCGIAGYLFITFAHTCSVFFSTSLSLPLCLLVDCCYDTLGITFNSSASFISSVL